MAGPKNPTHTMLNARVRRLAATVVRTRRCSCEPHLIVRYRSELSSHSKRNGEKITGTNRKRKRMSAKNKHRALKQRLIRSLRRMTHEFASHPDDHRRIMKVRALVRQICDRAAMGQQLASAGPLPSASSGSSSFAPTPVVFSPAEHTALISSVGKHGLWQEGLRLLQLAHDTGTTRLENSPQPKFVIHFILTNFVFRLFVSLVFAGPSLLLLQLQLRPPCRQPTSQYGRDM